jgi:hypothetical protein
MEIGPRRPVWDSGLSFVVRLGWLILDICIFVYLVFLESRFLDGLYNRLCSAIPGVSLIVIHFLWLAACAAQIMLMYRKLPASNIPKLGISWRNAMLMVSSGVGIFVMVVVWAFGWMWGKEERELFAKNRLGVSCHPLLRPTKTCLRFFAKKCPDLTHLFTVECDHYFRDRGTKITPGLYGLFIPWYVFHGLLFFETLQGKPGIANHLP